MAAPRQMTASTLNALKGWPQPQAVDFETQLDASVPEANKPVLEGSVVHVNASGKYELGVGTTRVMPLFTFQSSDDPDVENDGGDASTDRGVWVPISPTGAIMALVAVGAYELVSTSFVADDYDPNDFLTSDLAGVNAGKLKKGVIYTDMIVGVVSRGKVDNGFGFTAVSFWPFPIFPT